MKAHCFSHDSEERKTHGVTWGQVKKEEKKEGKQKREVAHNANGKKCCLFQTALQFKLVHFLWKQQQSQTHPTTHLTSIGVYVVFKFCASMRVFFVVKTKQMDSFWWESNTLERLFCWWLSSQKTQANRQVQVWHKNHSGSCALCVQICETTVGILCTSKWTFCESIHSTNTTSISWRHTVSAMVQKKERHMVWHDTQCCGWPSMGEMAAL